MASDAMSDAELAAMRRRAEEFRRDYEAGAESFAGDYADDVPKLLAEVERLRAELLEALKVVRGVATGPHWAIDLYALQEQARALLANEGSAGDGG